jgi:hypothetical protein
MHLHAHEGGGDEFLLVRPRRRETPYAQTSMARMQQTKIETVNDMSHATG